METAVATVVAAVADAEAKQGNQRETGIVILKQDKQHYLGSRVNEKTRCRIVHPIQPLVFLSLFMFLNDTKELCSGSVSFFTSLSLFTYFVFSMTV